jgi:excinuclease UvrABC nuclease subunit
VEGAVRVAFAPERAEEMLTAIPAARAVFVLRGDSGTEPFVSQTADLKRRLTRLLAPAAEQTKRLNLRERCRTIDYQITGSDFESRLILYRTLRREFPKSYRERLKLRFAAVIKLNLENSYPRAYVTRRIAKLPSKTKSRYYGPFPSRAAAEKFLNDALDFFKMRRCDFELTPDPTFPGCVYSEMKMCLAPCFKGCTDEQYRAEVARVRDFLDSGGHSLLRELGGDRERASGALQFEAASAVHARWGKVKALAASLNEVVRPIEHLNGLIIQRSEALGAVELFRMHQAFISGPRRFMIQAQAAPAGESATHSMEGRVSSTLAGWPVEHASSALELNEHLAILKRWYFRSRRQGEIFFVETNGELPLRRVVRGIGRVVKGEGPELGETEAANRAYWLARTRPQS